MPPKSSPAKTVSSAKPKSAVASSPAVAVKKTIAASTVSLPAKIANVVAAKTVATSTSIAKRTVAPPVPVAAVSAQVIDAYERSMRDEAARVAAPTIPVLPSWRSLKSKMARWNTAIDDDDEYVPGMGHHPPQVDIIIGQTSLIPSVLRDSLDAQLTVISNHPNKDYHPGSHDQVQNLIHPSMYPFVAGRTEWLPNDESKAIIQQHLKDLSVSVLTKAGLHRLASWKRTALRAQRRIELDQLIAENGANHWLIKEEMKRMDDGSNGDDMGPDFPAGDELTDADYFNDIPPPKVTTTSISSTTRGMRGGYSLDTSGDDGSNGDLSRLSVLERFRIREVGNTHAYYHFTNQSEVLGRPYEDSMYQWMPAEFHMPYSHEGSPDDGHHRLYGYTQIMSPINSLSRHDFPLLYRDIAAIWSHMYPMFEQIVPNLSDRCQVIVKAANYVIQPGWTDYKGSWHVEGMSHERIIASGIYYYYVSPHLKGAGLMFRRRKTNEAVQQSGQRTRSSTAMAIHDMGTVPTPAGTCLVFHNSYQHCVDTLTNTSTTQVGVRKILCFFLVDPQHRTVSTLHATNHHWSRLLPKLKRALVPLFPSSFPLILIHMICEYVTIGMTHREALAVRTDLMNERKYFIDEHNTQWQREFSLCEH